mmetsp:Transcript_22959/g.46112  ORF Transcript_22959/g.46112 Transcript_22959/m.46112 type:complete len:91 (+) Transcript_22959:139-411(+)
MLKMNGNRRATTAEAPNKTAPSPLVVFTLIRPHRALASCSRPNLLDYLTPSSFLCDGTTATPDPVIHIYTHMKYVCACACRYMHMPPQKK